MSKRAQKLELWVDDGHAGGEGFVLLCGWEE